MQSGGASRETCFVFHNKHNYDTMAFKYNAAYKPPLAQDYQGEEDVENPALQVPLVEVLEMSKRQHAIAVLSTFRFHTFASLLSSILFFYHSSIPLDSHAPLSGRRLDCSFLTRIQYY
jgi:hypothetical protein